MADTKDIIHQRILTNINDEYDKSQGSFFYDVEKPVAIELENIYLKLEGILNKGFVDTATGSDLDRLVAEVGLKRKEAKKASGIVTITGINGSKILKGDIVTSDSANFIFLQDLKIESGSIKVLVECEKYGTIGNVPVGAIKYFPVTIEGLQNVTNESAFTNGYEEENDEELRKRYYEKVQTPVTSGNKYHYLNWSKEVSGVGDAKVFPLWNGPGTVKVVIINSNKKGADNDLIDAVKEHIEENRPIGATVTVISATEKIINVTFNLTLELNYELENVKSNIESAITEYLKEIAFVRDYVSLAKIGAFVLDTDGVVDYTNLKLNGTADNVQIGNEEVAVLGGVVIG